MEAQTHVKLLHSIRRTLAWISLSQQHDMRFRDRTSGSLIFAALIHLVAQRAACQGSDHASSGMKHPGTMDL